MPITTKLKYLLSKAVLNCLPVFHTSHHVAMRSKVTQHSTVCSPHATKSVREDDHWKPFTHQSCYKYIQTVVHGVECMNIARGEGGREGGREGGSMDLLKQQNSNTKLNSSI